MLARCIPDDVRSLAIIGLSKNAGKTTALNHLVREWAGAGRVVGLVSVGVDGERVDRVTGEAKPAILVAPGMWVATSDGAIAQSTAAFDVVERTAARTPMGSVVVGRVRRSGRVLLAGVRHRADVRACAAALRKHGATHVIIDGAFDRLAAADPATSDATIIAAGAAAGPKLDDAVDRLAGTLARLDVGRWLGTTPPAELSALRGGAWRSVSGSLTLGVEEGERDADALFAPGLVADGGLERASSLLTPGGTLVLADPTRLVCSEASRAAFTSRRRIAALRPTRVVAVVSNPRRSAASREAAATMVDALAAVAGGRPVLDVVAGVRRGAG